MPGTLALEWPPWSRHEHVKAVRVPGEVGTSGKGEEVWLVGWGERKPISLQVGEGGLRSQPLYLRFLTIMDVADDKAEGALAFAREYGLLGAFWREYDVPIGFLMDSEEVDPELVRRFGPGVRGARVWRPRIGFPAPTLQDLDAGVRGLVRHRGLGSYHEPEDTRYGQVARYLSEKGGPWGRVRYDQVEPAAAYASAWQLIGRRVTGRTPAGKVEESPIYTVPLFLQGGALRVQATNLVDVMLLAAAYDRHTEGRPVVQCANETCGAWFLQTRSWGKYCSDTCHKQVRDRLHAQRRREARRKKREAELRKKQREEAKQDAKGKERAR